MSIPLLRSVQRRLDIARTQLRNRGMLSVARLARDRLNKLPMMEFGIRRVLLPFRVRHLSGPRRPPVGSDGLVAISVVRDGELWAKSFLAHHRALGARHFVILDNGSTDRTVHLFSDQPDVTLLQTHASYSAYENTMKRFLANRFCAGRWCLCVDVDELFEFPGSPRASLDALLSYCDTRGYNAVVTQMLDMFSDAPLRNVRSSVDDDIRATYPYYDISAIERSAYLSAVPDDKIQMHRGGIRKTVFGTDNGLTKISLFRMDDTLKPFVQWHHAEGARIANVSAVLLHYPFVETFYAKVVDAVGDGRYGYLTSDEYRAYLDSFDSNSEVRLRLATASRLDSIDQLVEEGFLVSSSDYLGFVGLIG